MKIDNNEARRLAEAGDYDTLRESGAVEVKELNVGGNKIVVRMDFNLWRKAYARLIDMSVSGSGVSTDLDMIGAGDKILEQGSILGGEIIGNLKLRAAACQELGAWVAEIAAQGDDSDKKKLVE